MTRSRATAGHRGFALLIVMAIAGATMVVAISLSRLAGSAAQVSAKEEQSLMAANAARTGLERASAYAAQIASATGGDFDLVLDPLDEADCTNMDPGGSDQPFDFTQVDGTNSILRPRFNDGSHVQWPAGSGKWWRLVPYLGGAYLVRFEDDGDDDCSLTVAATLSTWTSNHAGSGTCYEGVGTTADSPPGYNSAVNPVRDMNRAIWVISLGIFPGTDPAAARYRVTERRMVSDNSVSADAAFIADQLHAHSSADVVLESDEAISATNTNHVNSSGTWQMCRSESDTWNIGSGSTSPAAACGSLAYSQVDTGAITVPTVPAWNDKVWMDFNDPCNFLIRHFHGSGGGDPEALYWWNTGGQWGPGDVNRCDDEAAFGTIPTPANANTTNPDTPGSCWVPLMFDANPASGMADPCQLGEGTTTAGAALPTSGGVTPAQWRPNGGATATSADCSGYYTRALSAAPVLPNFLTTCSAGVTMPNGATYGSCATCDGSEWALRYEQGASQQWSARSSAGGQQLPVGTYFVLGEWDFGTDNWGGGTPPMITMHVSGDVTVSSSTNVAFGSGGQPGGAAPTAILPAFPGLSAANINVNSSSTFEVWGALYVRGAFDSNSSTTSTMRGPVIVEGQVTADSSSSFIWRYPDSFFPVTVTPGSTGARLSYPIRF